MTAPLLIHVGPSDLRRIWPMIRERVAGIAVATGEPWIAEDVYAEIAAGTAWLWATDDLGCFIVIQIGVATYSRDLVVWVASEETDARAADFLPQVQVMARECGCTRVVFNSPRRWDRALPGLTVRHQYSFAA